MYQVVAKRDSGKTKRLMEEALNNNGIFVCQNPYPASQKAQAYGFFGLQILSYDEFIENICEYPLTWTETRVKGYRDPDGRKFYIDNINGFVNFICLNTLGGYSLTIEDNE